MAWRLTNLTDQPIQILNTWLPHGEFLAERQPFDPPLVLTAGESCRIERSIRYSRAPGETVENAFLNLRVHVWAQTWRVLTRMRVERADTGLVRIAVEAVTSHREGFAETETARRTEIHGPA